MKIHQIWIGEAMPPDIAVATEKIRESARIAGWEYTLWRDEQIFERFKGSRALEILRKTEGVPFAKFAAVLSDWARWRILAEEGGMYLDTDTRLTTALPAARLFEIADISQHTRRGTRLETGCIVACGERGMEAARLVEKAVTERLVAFPDVSEAIERMHLPQFIGPQWVVSEVHPRLAEQGFTVGAIPTALASCSEKESILYHWGSWSWHRENVRKTAQTSNRKISRPLYEPRRIEEPKAELYSIFTVPAGTKRIVVFSNIRSFDISRVGLKEGDWCIHINRAVHAKEAMEVAGTVHTLFVRHGHAVGSGYKWHATSEFDGFRNVFFYGSTPTPVEPWLEEYRREAGTTNATSGFVCYQHAHAAAPEIPIVLAGFAPGEDIGYRWPHHGWDYEAEYYAKNNINLIHP